ncbi:bacillithiol biosynthesis cysteine-adding enzyme BshC [Balneolales bacterium ANBcel1]|nr:bacillithiol biosynthesis cysteine-adding enzyme BshC [Balneolales bacterium ANBcel1]
MDITKESFRKLPFSPLFRDFADGHEVLDPFLADRHSYESLVRRINDYSFSGDRRVSAEQARRFNRGFSLDTCALENIEALSDENTVTITTGQQVSLYGGPLYTVFKTLTVIHLAKSLSRDTAKHVVPVFWLADEDHDFEEIASVSLPVQGEVKRASLPCKACARHAAGNITVEESSFAKFRNEVMEYLPPTDFRDELFSLLDECYVPGRSLKQAFGELLMRLFSRHGLILAGSNEREAKRITRDAIRIAIERADDIVSALEHQSAELESHYHRQAHISDSLLFWHDDDHGRVRLVHDNGRWSREPGIELGTQELLNELETHPERFSPNVFLRPILQDQLLPNAAYVGGPAEIAYYAQMKPLYDVFDRKMPFLIARLSATIVEPQISRFLSDLPYTIPEYSGRFEELEQHYLRKYGEPDLDTRFDHWKEEVELLSEKMVEETEIADPGLRKHAQAITREYTKAIDKLRKKKVQAVRQKEEVRINRLKKVKLGLFPNDRLQEREISFIYFMNKYGPDIWEQLLTRLNQEQAGLFNRHLYLEL